MQIGIEDLWTAMERDITSGAAPPAGWMLRLVRPSNKCPLFAAVEMASRRRAILLDLPDSSIPPRRRWPSCKGLDPLTLRLDGHEHFGVALREDRFRDVFTALVEDLARRVLEAATAADRATAFIGQLGRWQKFLTASIEGLSEEKQRGLWGELAFMRDWLLSHHGPRVVAGWKGPEGAHQDFQYPSGAVEVKATLASQPQIVRITSERQLDESGWPVLLLAVFALELRERAGETLPELIAGIRSALSSDPASREQFEDGLLLTGYHDAHAGRYADRGYLVRSQTYLRIREGFPCLRERALPSGVGDLSYGLAVAACADYGIDEAEVTSAVATMLHSDECE